MRLALIALPVLMLLAPQVRADAVTEANAKACALVSQRTPPGPSRRTMALIQASVFEAVNAVTGRYADARLDLGRHPGASAEAAVFSATRSALLALLPADREAVEAWFREALAKVPEGPARREGVDLGAKAAEGMLALRKDDGALAPESYRPRTQPGVYVPTVIPANPQWPGRTPWVLSSARQFRPGPPPALDSATWAADFNEVKAYGGKTSAVRTAAQQEVAKFWEDTSSAIYFGVVRSAAEGLGRDLTDNARLFDAAAIAMDDALIAVFDAKYAYHFWRPITAIRNGEEDGNPATVAEPGWLPFIDTPMHPEYPCAHCILVASLAEVIEAAVPAGKPLTLSTTSLTAPGVIHRWSSTAALAEEVAQARIWAGVHYRNSTKVGEAMGRQVGRLVAQLRLAGFRR